MKVVKIKSATKFPMGPKHCDTEILDYVWKLNERNWLNWGYLNELIRLEIFWQVKREERQ